MIGSTGTIVGDALARVSDSSGMSRVSLEDVSILLGLVMNETSTVGNVIRVGGTVSS